MNKSASSLKQFPVSNYRSIFPQYSLLNVPGYLVGYVSHRKPDAAAESCPSVAPVIATPEEEGQDEGPKVAYLPGLSWNDISTLLEQKLSPDAFSTKLRYSS